MIDVNVGWSGLPVVQTTGYKMIDVSSTNLITNKRCVHTVDQKTQVRQEIILSSIFFSFFTPTAISCLTRDSGGCRRLNDTSLDVRAADQLASI